MAPVFPPSTYIPPAGTVTQYQTTMGKLRARLNGRADSGSAVIPDDAPVMVTETIRSGEWVVEWHPLPHVRAIKLPYTDD